METLAPLWASLKHFPLKPTHIPRRVMAGLVPAIHAFAEPKGSTDVDARDKRGHDGGGMIQSERDLL